MAATEANLKSYQLRANLPVVARYVALVAMAVAVIVVVVSFFQGRTHSDFKLKSEHTNLSKDVVAEVNNYERLETDEGVQKYYIKADYAKTFSDNHQELQNMYLEVYDKDGATSKMTSQAALYVPEEDKNFTAYLKGDVNIETPQALKIKTNNLVYTRRTQVADADEAVEFERDTVKGKSLGATVRLADKQVDLLKDVEIESFESPEMLKAGVRYAKLNASSAMFDQIANRIDLNGGIAVNIASKASSGQPQNTDVNASRAVAYLGGSEGKSPQLKKLELFENVHIVTAESGQPATTIDSGYALFDKDALRYELKNGSHIVTVATDKSTDIRSSEAVYEQGALKAALTGSAEITQGADYLKADAINADLFRDNKLRHAVMRGNAFVKQTSAEKIVTVSGPELNVSYNDAKQLSDANAIGQSSAELTPVQASSRYSNVVMAAEKCIGLIFKGEGLIDAMRTDGRTTINMTVPNGEPDSANKRLTADIVKTTFAPNGKDIAKAEATGTAELYIEPLNAGKKNYKTTINAPRFDCDFFATGNNVKVCVAGVKGKVTRVPTVQVDGRGTQYLTADQFNAQFNEKTNDVDRLDASGNAKFTELDKNAIAKQMSFTQADQMVRLRGGEPTAWDSRARAKAREIDLDTQNNKSFLRGGVSTTYYSKKQMREAGPFASTDKPVFVTADTAEIDNDAETTLYTGSPRAWQENNYVRGERLAIDQKAGTFRVDGSVQSVLYNAKVRQRGHDSTQPVYAASTSMSYSRDSRVLQYRKSVDVRQGSDRITSESVDVFMDQNNELSKTIAEQNVVITQPGRRAVGSWAQYTAADDVAVIRGDPATVTDSENGSSTAAQLTFNMRDNKVVTEGRTKQNTTGRTRSVYKVKPN
ncbi:MAG TPA: LPS export ABC transporter periplasmic protein LptC [Pyrinomonadaceae bacterium]|nr:LPS export ABC transporter periplasmic protein LptC [Pyrinomonadaceae bacterium]